MYDATIGRWLGQDPLGFQAADSNLYRYAGNAPTAQTDPSGTLIGLIAPAQILAAQLGFRWVLVSTRERIITEIRYKWILLEIRPSQRLTDCMCYTAIWRLLKSRVTIRQKLLKYQRTLTQWERDALDAELAKRLPVINYLIRLNEERAQEQRDRAETAATAAWASFNPFSAFILQQLRNIALANAESWEKQARELRQQRDQIEAARAAMKFGTTPDNDLLVRLGITFNPLFPLYKEVVKSSEPEYARWQSAGKLAFTTFCIPLDFCGPPYIPEPPVPEPDFVGSTPAR